MKLITKILVKILLVITVFNLDHQQINGVSNGLSTSHSGFFNIFRSIASNSNNNNNVRTPRFQVMTLGCMFLRFNCPSSSYNPIINTAAPIRRTIITTTAIPLSLRGEFGDDVNTTTPNNDTSSRLILTTTTETSNTTQTSLPINDTITATTVSTTTANI